MAQRRSQPATCGDAPSARAHAVARGGSAAASEPASDTQAADSAGVLTAATAAGSPTAAAAAATRLGRSGVAAAVAAPPCHAPGTSAQRNASAGVSTKSVHRCGTDRQDSAADRCDSSPSPPGPPSSDDKTASAHVPSPSGAAPAFRQSAAMTTTSSAPATTTSSAAAPASASRNAPTAACQADAQAPARRSLTACDVSTAAWAVAAATRAPAIATTGAGDGVSDERASVTVAGSETRLSGERDGAPGAVRGCAVPTRLTQCATQQPQAPDAATVPRKQLPSLDPARDPGLAVRRRRDRGPGPPTAAMRGRLPGRRPQSIRARL